MNHSIRVLNNTSTQDIVRYLDEDLKLWMWAESSHPLRVSDTLQLVRHLGLLERSGRQICSR